MATVKVSRTASCSRAINYAEKRAEVKDGYNCDIENAKAEMARVREMYEKTTGIQAHLIIQSFSPSESQQLGAVTINHLGRELAERIAPDHQVAVYTHVDKEHVHNHLVINSVNLETGYKYQAHGTQALDFFKEQNDQIAIENSLEIVQKTAVERKPMAELKLEEKGIPTWKQEIRHAIDTTMQDPSTTSYNRFREDLSKKGVNVYERGQNATYELLKGNKKVRGSKLGEDYQKETIFGELERRGAIFQKGVDRSHEKAQKQDQQAEEVPSIAADAQQIRSNAIKQAAEKERKQQAKEQAERIKQQEKQKQVALNEKNSQSLSKGMELGR